jgi:hypothetical protein
MIFRVPIAKTIIKGSNMTVDDAKGERPTANGNNGRRTEEALYLDNRTFPATRQLDGSVDRSAREGQRGKGQRSMGGTHRTKRIKVIKVNAHTMILSSIVNSPRSVSFDAFS